MQFIQLIYDIAITTCYVTTAEIKLLCPRGTQTCALAAGRGQHQTGVLRPPNRTENVCSLSSLILMQSDTHISMTSHTAHTISVRRSQDACNIKINGNGKVILDTHPESDQHQN